MSPAAASKAAFSSAPSPVSAKPLAKHTAPPAPLADRSRRQSMVAVRFTPMKQASGAAGKSAILRIALSAFGCTCQTGPWNPILSSAPMTDRHHAPPPITATESGRNKRFRLPITMRKPVVAFPCTETAGALPQTPRYFEPKEAWRYAPRGRSKSRLMMWRWISDVPSQIRSTRASRQKRSMG